MAKSKNKKKQPKPKPIVLELRDVTFTSTTTKSVLLHGANLIVRQGELVMLRINRAQKCRDIASMLLGLNPPSNGEILFENQDWRGEDYDRHFAMRSRIGRVFEEQAWVQNFNVMENVTLASRHHRPRDKSVQQQVATWIERFKPKSKPFRRPGFVDAADLQVYQWIRALIGNPNLLILERPMNSVPNAMLAKLVEATNESRNRGAAVIWFTNNVPDRHDDFAKPRLDYQMVDGRFQPVAGESRDE